MKKTYETFEEIAKDFVDGESWTHTSSGHNTNECIVWQLAILQFAEWLDGAGIKLPDDSTIYEKLWDVSKNKVCLWESPHSTRTDHNPSTS